MSMFKQEVAQLLQSFVRIHQLLFGRLEQGSPLGNVFVFHLIKKDENGFRRFSCFLGNHVGHSLADAAFLLFTQLSCHPYIDIGHMFLLLKVSCHGRHP